MKLNLSDYTYDLPPERIALYPLEIRDQAKLLVYNKGNIIHNRFDSLAAFIPENALLFFNDTKVIPARLHFKKDTGADIEIFLLNPLLPSSLIIEAMQAKETCTWKCTIGNLKRWNKEKKLVKLFQHITLEATLVNPDEGVVRFNWNTDLSFSEIINLAGETPLPPYLKRKAEATDLSRYQTIYSQHEGAVAAPTAGLHFTDQVLELLQQKGIEKDFLTLHVSAGTFQPIKVENALEHTMHSEQIIIHKTNIKNLLKDKFIIPVGTTSMRSLESLYWYGVKLLNNKDAEFNITQTDPYQDFSSLPDKAESMRAVLEMMEDKETDFITGQSSIYIYPGYKFRICDALITNFHQPGSTLILLVAALAGPGWKKIYEEALNNNYRFLSFGDSSLIIP